MSGDIAIIVEVQQARYRHARAIESLTPLSPPADHIFDQAVKFSCDSFGLKAQGIEDVLRSQTEFMKTVGPHKSTINRLTVEIGEKVTSVDENFIYSTLTGTCVAIFHNQIEWVKKDNKWLIKSQIVTQDWAQNLK